MYERLLLLPSFHSAVPYYYQASPQLAEKQIIHIVFFLFPSSTQQFHQAGEPVFYLHKHMAHSCWFHTSGKWLMGNEQLMRMAGWNMQWFTMKQICPSCRHR